VHTDKDANDDASRDGSTTSDNDPGERPVRRKLKQTTITSASEAAEDNDAGGPSDDQSNTSEENENGDIIDGERVIKKRSFDDLQADDVDATDSSSDDGDHRRKRSCDSEAGDDLGVRNAGHRTPSEENEEYPNQILSPKKKRSIDQLKCDDIKGDELSAKEGEEVLISDDKSKNSGEPEKKRHRDNSEEMVTDAQANAVPSTTSLPKPFSNTSAVSPFASLASPKPSDASTEKEKFSNPAHVTSASAFASSGLAAFASSEQSPFGTLGSSTRAPSVFQSPFNPVSDKPSTPKFAAASGPSPFAATRTSGFAALGSGFGGSALPSGFCSTFKAGGGLTSFASPGGPGILGGPNEVKPHSGLGDDSGEDNENEESNPMEGFGKEKEDERFFEQEIETGEEDEMTYFTCKAKLFHFTGEEWKERGIGTFKVNVKEPEDCEDGKKSARLIMRADGVLRVMLNTPIFKGMSVGDGSGKEPTTKQLHLASLENGRSVPLLLRTANDDLAKELYRVILDLQQQL
jgi:Ran-binding protein 3